MVASIEDYSFFSWVEHILDILGIALGIAKVNIIQDLPFDKTCCTIDLPIFVFWVLNDLKTTESINKHQKHKITESIKSRATDFLADYLDQFPYANFLVYFW